ncbi:hypothetical protein B9Z55_025779 [Caenorhabditis nigoni]|uniref:Uncharacterized protein n=2 Tax=Caenorhabditis nigoni TaxID=1611254 RepID=A0A2G5T0L4_9PELO|nr:hypothetical protein B9Z55_025779 [Caenorhabditis nigoni]
MSDPPEDPESNNENNLSRFLLNKQHNKDYGLFPLDQEERQEIFSDMRAFDFLGRNYRNVLRAKISDTIFTVQDPPRLINYLDDVPLEELIQFIHTQEEDDQWVRRVLTNLSNCSFSVEEHLSSRNNCIQSYQQWDIKNWQDCYENILKDVFYLYEKHGEMFVRALNHFITPLHNAFIDDDPFAEDDYDDCYIVKRDEKEDPYDFEKLFSHCLYYVLECQTSRDCGYYLQVLAPWLNGAKKALRNSRADFNLYDRERMRIQRKQRLAKFKIEKENGFFVLNKYVAEDQKVSMQMDGVKSEISMEKKKAKKRKLVIDVTKSKKKQEMASTTIETSSSFHRSTPFPSNGGFSQCEFFFDLY